MSLRTFSSPFSKAGMLLLASAALGAPFAVAQSTGVAHPPSDDAIVTSDDPIAPQSAEKAAQVQAKPSPGVPVRTVNAPPPAPVTPPENPDYGVVTSTEDKPAAPAEQRPVHLVPRPSNPDYGVVGIVPSPSNQLAEGTDIKVRLLQALSTDHTQDGQPFRAQVSADVYKEGRVVIPMGSELRGRVTKVEPGHRLRNHATLRLRPEAVILPDGTAYHLYAEAVASSEPGTKTDSEGGIQPKAHVVKDLAEYGGGAGGGAIVGAALGGPVGAGAGAIVGAGLVTTHLLLQKPQDAKLQEGSEVVFSLTEPMDLLPTRN